MSGLANRLIKLHISGILVVSRGFDDHALGGWKEHMKSLLNRLWLAIVEEMLTNWRLALLGLTGLALSFASGWTTWDGMNNFTGNAVLSLLITFGIQGVMLIAAWLIGETFALGLSNRGDGHSGGVFWGLFLLISVVVIALLLALFFGRESSELGRSIFDFGQRWSSSVAGVVLVLVLIGALIYAVTQREVIGPYLRGSKIIVQNLPIWLMFLACMGTSVFFSFDSLFSTIFPEDERKRAGDIRAQNNISGIVADVEARLKSRQAEARRALFASEAWAKYDSSLELVFREARRAPELINAERKKKIASRQLEAQRFREQQSTAEGRFRNLKVEKDRRLEIIDRLEKLRPPVVAEVDTLASDLQVKRKALLEAKAVAMAEARGVGNSQQSGRGPKYRALQKVVTKLSIEEDLIEEQLKGAQENLSKLDRQIGTARREVEAFETQIATYGSQAEAARTMLEMGKSEVAEGAGSGGGMGAFSAEAFERSKSGFRQAPTRVKFARLQARCGSILAALITVPQLKSSVEGVDCEPKDANALAAQVFSYNDAIKRYGEQCGKSAALTQGDVDGLIKHGQKCLQLSGLSGEDSADFRASFNRIELNRDDKAHRFVVTWNAFLDGNRLAYLALAIAIAVDGLVFMSGMFGANAMKSPLSEGSGASGRTAAQLDDLLESALLPDKLRGADLVLTALKPSSREGFSQKVDLSALDDEARRVVQNVINAGSVIGLVDEDGSDPDIYHVRRQLFEKLSHIRQKEIRLSKSEAVDHGLRQTLERALLPEHETLSNISHVMRYLHPSDVREGFGLEADLADADSHVLERVKRVFTAGASCGVVKPHPKIPKTGYLIKNAFHEHLDAIRAKKLKTQPADSANEKMDFDRRIKVGKLVLDEDRVKRQLSERSVQYLEAPKAPESAPSIDRTGAQSVEHYEDDFGLNQDGEMPLSVQDYYANRLGLEYNQMEFLMGSELVELSKNLDGALSLIGRSHPLISESVEGSKKKLREIISGSRQVLLAKYAGQDDKHREIRDIAELLYELRPLFVLVSGGSYDQAVNFYVNLSLDELHLGAGEADGSLKLFEQHADDLTLIPRDFSVDAEWDKLEHLLNEFYRKLDSSLSSAGHHSSEFPLN